MNFKEWLKLKEVGTSTACIAVFARPLFSVMPKEDEKEEKEEKPKKKKKLTPKG